MLNPGKGRIGWLVVTILLVLSAAPRAEIGLFLPDGASGPKKAAASPPVAQPAPEQASREGHPPTVALLAGLPLIFEANQGQTHPQVDFLARGRGYTLFLTPTEAVLALESKPTVLRMKLVGANAQAKATGRDRLPTRINYFRGNDPKKWATAVPTYARVRYPQVYPGIDLVYYGNSGQLEYDFVVAPGADPRAIRLEFEGTKKLGVDAEGNLVVHLPADDLRFHKPRIYQGGARPATRDRRPTDQPQPVPGSYVLLAKNQVGFQVGAYDSTQPLIIDPVLSYSTYLGGSSTDNSIAIAIDADRNIYVMGETRSNNFPTQDASQSTFGGAGSFFIGDIFVAKIDPTQSGTASLLYSTYLGGSDDELAGGLAVDANGNVYVAGSTRSTDFPTQNAFQSAFGGAGSAAVGDAFVVKLDPSQSGAASLLYSTYLGGSGDEFAHLTGAAIGIDASGNAYLSGVTSSSDFPTRNALQDTLGGQFDVFVTKVDPTQSGDASLLYSTYLGGSGDDGNPSLAVDAAGNAYLTGFTSSTDFPTHNAFQTNQQGAGDLFVAKLDPSQSGAASLLYSTYLGGSSTDAISSIALDDLGNVYVAGFDPSNNFPTRNAFQNTGGINDAFLAKLDPTLSGDASLLYSTYLGGSGAEFHNTRRNYLAVDSSGNAYITGNTQSSDFPLKNAFQNALGGGDQDIFVAKFDPAQSGAASLIYSSFLGGSDAEFSPRMGVDASGHAYLTGKTESTDFPVQNALQDTLNANGDVFVTKVQPSGSELVYSTYLGGDGFDEFGIDIAVDDQGNAYVTGRTNSTDFPTQNAFAATRPGGGTDIFVAKITDAESVPDNFDDSGAINTASFSDTTDTSTATTEPDDPTPSCGGGSRDNSVWYEFTAEADGTIHLDTLESDYDTVVSVWTGAPGSFTQVACNDDVEANSGGGSLVLAQTVSAGNSSVSFPANGGTTYFIMVSGKGGGGGLTISLAFQASNNPLPPNTVGTIIPHSALGGGFLSRVFITNLSNNLNRVVINRVGQPGSVIDSASTFLEPAATAQVAASEAARTGDLTIEWFTIGSEADVASSLLFEFDSESLGLEENFRTAVGTLAAESLSAFTVPVRVATVEVTVGLALADLSGSSNTVNLTLRDQNGAAVAQDSLTLAAFEQTAFSLQDREAFSDIILGVPEFIGSLAVETADPNQSVAAIVIGNNLRQLYALPVIPGVASSSGSTLRAPSTRSMVTRSRPAPGLAQAIPAGNFTTLIPHSAAGGGFLSRLFVVNLTGNTNNLTINRIGQDGTVVTTTDAMLDPAGTLMLPDDDAVRGENLTIEWFAIGSEMPIGASLLFEFDSASLGLEENFLTAVGSLAADPLSSFTTPIRVATVDVTAGVALANPNDASTTVNLELLNQGGTVVAQDSLTLGAFEQTAFSLQDRAAFSAFILGVPEFIGALAVTTTDANRPVAALVIGNNLGQLFALPVTPGVAQ